MSKYSELAVKVLQAVGGKENVANVTHCVTRLRFNLKDESIAKDEEIKGFDGVAGVIHAANQYQVVIGPEVNKVYAEVSKMVGNLAAGEVPADAPKEKLTLKKIGNNILDYLSGSLTPLIPMLVGAAMFEAILAIFGPDMLGLMSADSDLYVILDFAANAAFYFLPIVVGGFAAKKLGATPVLGMFMGGILMHPIFLGLVTEGASLSLFGLPVAMNDYSSTIFPILLSVWILSYVERFFNKYIPVSLKFVFAPFLTIVVMIPIALVVVGPIGTIIGNVLFSIINGLDKVPGVGSWFALAIVAAIWEFVVMAGMHWMFIASAAASIAAGGVDSILSPAAAPAGFAVGGMIVGALLLQKKQEDRSLSISYLIAQVIGGLVEPGLYGIGFKYKRPFIGMMIGGFAAGLYNGIFGVVAYNMVPVSSVLAAFAFIGGPTSNFVHGIISFIIAFVVAAVATYFIGLEKKEA